MRNKARVAFLNGRKKAVIARNEALVMRGRRHQAMSFVVFVLTILCLLLLSLSYLETKVEQQRCFNDLARPAIQITGNVVDWGLTYLNCGFCCIWY